MDKWLILVGWQTLPIVYILLIVYVIAMHFLKFNWKEMNLLRSVIASLVAISMLSSVVFYGFGGTYAVILGLLWTGAALMELSLLVRSSSQKGEQ